MPGTVVILGAGASKSAKGPLTEEILPHIILRKDLAPQLGEFAEFLRETFHTGVASGEAEYPSLPLLMSLLDTAIARKQSFLGRWDLQGVTRMRRAVELGIFQVLEDELKKAPTTNHYQLLSQLFPATDPPCVVSMNYDLIIDTSMMFYSASNNQPALFPDYRCDIQTQFYRDQPRYFGTLLKLHGSLNWMYCSTCQRLDLGASASMLYVKIMGKLLTEEGMTELESAYASGNMPCPNCNTTLEPLLIAPSHLKDYRNPHISRVWYEAERVLRQCDRAIFIGYSLPSDDVEVVYLLKRSLGHLCPTQITVIQRDGLPLNASPVRRRYHALFGNVDWHSDGLDAWLGLAANPAHSP